MLPFRKSGFRLLPSVCIPNDDFSDSNVRSRHPLPCIFPQRRKNDTFFPPLQVVLKILSLYRHLWMTYILAKVFSLVLLQKCGSFLRQKDCRYTTARALSMQLGHILWQITPYNAECGVVSSLSLSRFFHNLCKDK